MKKTIFTTLFVFLWILGYAQDKEIVYPNFIGQDLSSIENNSEWTVTERATGDLNKDNQDDIVIVIESVNEVFEKRCSSCDLEKKNARIILVFLNKKGVQKAIIQNNKFIKRSDEGGMMPSMSSDLSIKDGQLIISNLFTRSAEIYTFEIIGCRMEIVKMESFETQGPTGDYWNFSYDFKKGEATSESGNILEGNEDQTTIGTSKFTPKSRSLSEFGEEDDWSYWED